MEEDQIWPLPEEIPFAFNCHVELPSSTGTSIYISVLQDNGVQVVTNSPHPIELPTFKSMLLKRRIVYLYII